MSKEAEEAIEEANSLSDEEFLQRLIHPSPESSWPEWTHPQTGATYHLRLTRTEALTEKEVDDCLALVQQTSGDAYRASANGWRPGAKRREMRTAGLRYVLVRGDRHHGPLVGFVSMMLTWEAGEAVVYCYEIHLEALLRGSGLGTMLMGFVASVARRTPHVAKVMLTCFTSNSRARAFYSRLGYGVDASSPRETRELRGGRTVGSQYVILSLVVD
ncbi:hypothetical protein L249_0271 [Ophiocordyceps polyrhachis-furcata BCC 54312]|uniref:N-alpha-acetyltransferase 40 n=1 Tax=Ophiocordyceps polyrhachis-furcata BCC 54312 TaxID=1330021 RepID=A0A367LD03_9HYPO|nr:hypothetical protein L249_0271 [Ophiocordyceps polyrhachis-furcata BCC 54312]